MQESEVTAALDEAAIKLPPRQTRVIIRFMANVTSDCLDEALDVIFKNPTRHHAPGCNDIIAAVQSVQANRKRRDEAPTDLARPDQVRRTFQFLTALGSTDDPRKRAETYAKYLDAERADKSISAAGEAELMRRIQRLLEQADAQPMRIEDLP